MEFVMEAEERDVESQAAYDQGRAAFGKKSSNNPYPSAAGQARKRIAWWDGWLDARTEHRLGPIFRKHGMEL